MDARIQELVRRCNEGQLAAQEQADYETIARFIKFISILQSKARARMSQPLAVLGINLPENVELREALIAERLTRPF